MQSGRVPAVSDIPEPSPPDKSCKIMTSDRGFEIKPPHRKLTLLKCDHKYCQLHHFLCYNYLHRDPPEK